jgi:hypothetical protein
MLIAWLGLSSLGNAGLDPDTLKTADGKKTQAYLKDGLFVGGDRAITPCTVKDIRRAANADFERIVIDLEGNLNGAPAAIQRPPFFQAAVTPDEKRVVVSIWGNPELKLDTARIVRDFKKSAVISKVELFPKVEADVWTFALNLKTEAAVEVFELTQPTRIILDVRQAKAKSSSAHSPSGSHH